MLPNPKGTDDSFHTAFDPFNRFTVEMVVVIVCNNQKINLFRHILGRIAIRARKRFVDERDGRGGDEYRIHQDGDPMD